MFKSTILTIDCQVKNEEQKKCLNVYFNNNLKSEFSAILFILFQIIF